MSFCLLHCKGNSDIERYQMANKKIPFKYTRPVEEWLQEKGRFQQAFMYVCMYVSLYICIYVFILHMRSFSLLGTKIKFPSQVNDKQHC